MEEEKILNVTQLGAVDKLQNEDVILLIRNTDNGKQCFQIKGFDFRGESAYEAAQSQGFEGTYQDWVQQIKEITEYDTKSLLSFNGIANNDANSALRSGIYPSVTKNVPINGETFTIQTLRTTTAVYNQYVSTQIALGATGAAIGKVYIRKNTQKSGAYTFGDWIKISNYTSATKKTKPKTQYIIGKAIPIGKLNGGARLNAYVARNGLFRFKLSNVPQIRHLIDNKVFSDEAVQELFKDVTWHLFIDDEEFFASGASTIFGGSVLSIDISSISEDTSFYQLDETKSSVNVSSDMYIYLRTVPGDLRDAKVTSKTLSYRTGERIWKPNIRLPYKLPEKCIFNNLFNIRYEMQLQKLLTCQRRSKQSGLEKTNISKFGYRGNRAFHPILRYGIYRYRFVKDGKKTQWRTISILKNNNGLIIK